MTKKKTAPRLLKDAPQEQSHWINVRLTNEMFQQMEELRQYRDIVPTKTEMVRFLIKIGIAVSVKEIQGKRK